MNRKIFFGVFLRFVPDWDYKPNKQCTSGEVLDKRPKEKTNITSECIYGSTLSGVKKPKLFSFASDKLPGFKFFCEVEILHYQKVNKSVLVNYPFRGR